MAASTNQKKGSFMNVEIAQRLAEMRREQGYSQEELAAQLGLSRQAVSKWERAESSPDTGNLIALADLYDVTLDELVRVEADINDDVRFESTDKSTSAEIKAQEAVVAASAAAVQAAQAAMQAQVAAATPQQSTAPAQPCQPQASAQPYGATPPVAAPVPPQPQYAQQPYSAPMPPVAPQASGSPESGPHRRSPWMTFPYPVLCVVVFLMSGFLFGIWHPAWLVFLTIPLYYWVARIIENDPNYRSDRR